MFLLLAIVLVLLWAGGFFLMHISSFFIHLLIILRGDLVGDASAARK